MELSEVEDVEMAQRPAKRFKVCSLLSMTILLLKLVLASIIQGDFEAGPPHACPLANPV